MRLKEELASINDIATVLADQALTVESTNELTAPQKKHVKQAVICIIKILSNRIRELRQFIVYKKRAVENLLKRVEGDGRESKLSSAISYIQTQLIRLKACAQTNLRCVDDLGYMVAHLNGTSSTYVRGIGVMVDLGRQANYTCLRKLDDALLDQIDHKQNSQYIKQRTNAWHELRSGACVTGSTMHKALGLGTLKQQKEHVLKGRGIQPVIGDQLQSHFDYGEAMEKHALGTLVGKIMPVHFPELIFVEDGCAIIPIGDKFCVISGDGSGSMTGSDCKVAFEIKCPIPGKKFATDAYYQLPSYYCCQVLSQMKSKGCNNFANICYTPDSTTVITGQFDSSLWETLVDLATKLYGNSEKNVPLPSRKEPEVKEICQLVSKFSQNSVFMAEYPSARATNCMCDVVTDLDDVYGHHQNYPEDLNLSLDDCAMFLTNAGEALKDAYDLLRRPAKEILVTMLSDLDRTYSDRMQVPYSLPIMYHLGGYSLKMDAVRKILKDAITECDSRKLRVCAAAFDGQFLEITTTDEDGNPLTVCQLQKQVWKESQKLSKQQQVSYLSGLNFVGRMKSFNDFAGQITFSQNGQTKQGFIVEKNGGYRQIHLPPNFHRWVIRQDKASEPDEIHAEDCDFILRYLPEDILGSLDAETINIVQEASKAIAQSLGNQNVGDGGEEEMTIPVDLTEESTADLSSINTDQVTDTDLEAALCGLIALYECYRFHQPL